MYLLYYKLNHFGFKLLTDDFIDKMKAQLKDAVHVATIDTFDWESIKPCKKYEKRLRGKKLRYPTRSYEFDWKDDSGEKARRIWEWWRVEGERKKIISISIRGNTASCSCSDFKLCS